MSLQYISDNSGNTTAVIIPIDDWNGIREKYPDVESVEGELPQWQKDLIDRNLQAIADNPHLLMSKEDFFTELDKED